MKAVLIDFIILLILAVSVWRGAKKGMIMTLSGLVILICAFAFSGYLAQKATPYVHMVVDPFLSGAAEKAASSVMRENPAEEPDSVYAKEVAVSAFAELGVWDGAATDMGAKLSDGLEDVVGASIRRAISETFCDSVAYVIAYIAALLIIILVVAFIANLLDLAFKLPGLDMLNRFGGMGLGLLYGLAMVFVITWTLRFFGGLIGPETIRSTVLLKFFMNFNPLAAIFSA